MKSAYTIDEILDAVDELQKNNKKKIKNINKNKLTKTENSDIPIKTLKLIEEAEKKLN
tara:strand:+ start:1116 stop:1289 length:174 start_codon:yes stop_codon:yes gene_type:complete